MDQQINTRVLAIANYFLNNETTVRALADLFGYSKSTVHYDLSTRLAQIDPLLALKVKTKLNANYQTKHWRGGEATRLKYLRNS